MLFSVFSNKDESGVNFSCYFTFICFFLTVIIDILLDYDFTKKKIIRIFLFLILLSLSTFSQAVAFFLGIPFCIGGCKPRHPLNVLHGIMVVVMIVYMIAYLIIFQQPKSNQQITQLNNPQLGNNINYNDNAIYNNNYNLLTPQNTENIII